VTAALVSVVIPFRDRERYLAEAVESVLAQTHRPLEVILVDDGSTDRSATVATRFVPPARYVRQSPAGAGAARNAGIVLARGDFIAFCDSDDRWEPRKLASQLEAFAADPGLAACFTLVQEFVSPELDPAELRLRPLRDAAAGIIPSAALLRREALERVGPFSVELRLEWPEWYARLKDAGLRTVVVEEALVHRRLHATNLGIDRDAQGDYLRALKASLDRRRSAT
jgi:glycosyltransferase involved in cell wall biosynthesis